MARTAITNWDELPVFMNVKDLARVLGVGINHAYQLTRSEGFPAVRVGGRIVINRDGLRGLGTKGEATAPANDIAGSGCAVNADRRQADAAAPVSSLRQPAVV